MRKTVGHCVKVIVYRLKSRTQIYADKGAVHSDWTAKTFLRSRHAFAFIYSGSAIQGF